MTRTIFMGGVILLLSACAGSTPTPSTPAPAATVTRVPPTATLTLPPPTATATEVVPTEVPPTPTSAPVFAVSSFTCPALPTRLAQGVIARIPYSSGAGLRIRVSPRFIDANIFDLVAEGSVVDILEGPACAFDNDGSAYIFWKIRDREADITGWAAEGDADSYFLEYNYPPRPLRNDAQLIEAYQEALAIMLNPALKISEKRAQFLVFQRTYGEDVLLQVIEYVAVYDDGLNYFHNFDAFIRSVISPYGAWRSDSPYEREPIAAGLSIFFDPSEENIRLQLGLE